MTDLTLSHKVVARNEIFSRHQNRLQLSRLLHNWLTRRKVRALNEQDDHILDDIGVERGEVIWASRLPLTVNAAIALDDRARRRRQHQQ